MTVPSRAKMALPVNGERIEISRIPHRRCPDCGEGLLTLQAATRLQETAHAIYRERHGLLAPEEIRRLRESLGLSQASLAELLHLGANTISRWETGRIVQSASMDVLLRMVRDLPGSLDYLQTLAA